MHQFRPGRVAVAATFAAALALSATAQAAVIYSNDFQSAGSASNALTAGGTLSSLTLTSLPTDGGGLASAQQSQWLGRQGYGVAKDNHVGETVSLALSGLSAGTVYRVDFDLFIGASWDGSANGYGPDRIVVQADSGATSATLLSASFANGAQGINFGAYSPQTYSDATPVASDSNQFARFTGADAFYSRDQGGYYEEDYSIYRFGSGAGNPVLTFTAGAGTAVITFGRPVGNSDSADEYWALDNLRVATLDNTGDTNGVPEPATLAVVAAGLALLAAQRRRQAR